VNKHKQGEDGFTLVHVAVVLVVVAAIVTGITIFTRDNPKQTVPAQSSAVVTKNSPAKLNEPVEWMYNDQMQKYVVAKGVAPKCKEPFTFDYSPIDTMLATSVMMPGQYRGGNYKPHGGFRLDTSKTGEVTVKMPMDAKIVGLTRYIESPDNALQYLVTFENDCGIAFRFDHFATLSPRLQAIAETRPAARLDDTRASPNDKPKPELFKAGEVIATAIGHQKIKNFGFDFGVYDYRQANDISKTNAKWAALHKDHSAQDWYGVCWFDMLPGTDATRAKTLSEKVINPKFPNIISDYCKNAKYTTMDFNNGQPTNG
jgi:hypothetical protein